jgi:hypothetical protein
MLSRWETAIRRLAHGAASPLQIPSATLLERFACRLHAESEEKIAALEQ